MEKDKKTRYLRAQKSSFQTKLNLFIFEALLNGKASITLSEFEAFEITASLVKIYTTQYWQQAYDVKVGGSRFTVNELYQCMQILKQQHALEIALWEESYAQQFKGIFPVAAFRNLLNDEKCVYCGIELSEIMELNRQQRLFKKSERGWSLEIDRKNSNFEYTPDNCVLACYWCNNAKTDEFTFEEFKEIGKSIGQVWKIRLNMHSES